MNLYPIEYWYINNSIKYSWISFLEVLNGKIELKFTVLHNYPSQCKWSCLLWKQMFKDKSLLKKSWKVQIKMLKILRYQWTSWMDCRKWWYLSKPFSILYNKSTDAYESELNIKHIYFILKIHNLPHL